MVERSRAMDGSRMGTQRVRMMEREDDEDEEKETRPSRGPRTRFMDDYYSLDQLLAENQRIPCIFNITVPGVGYLEGTSERDLRPHTQVELPFWLASILSQQDEDQDREQSLDPTNSTHSSQKYLTIQMPKAFNQQIRYALAASTKNVNLKNLSVHSGGAWYESGKVLLEMIEDNNLREVLHKTFVDRLPDVMDLAARPPPNFRADPSGSTNPAAASSHHNPDDDHFLLGLDSWENEILSAGQQTAKRMREWERSRITS